MSYEGYVIFLCEEGHKSACDAYESIGDFCKHNNCNKPFVWSQGIDQTNGYYKDDPNTFERKLDVVGFDDIWKTDHYGNKYAIKLLKYAIPEGKPGYRIRK